MTRATGRLPLDQAQDPDQIRESYAAFRANADALIKDYTRLLQQHSGHWAAYYHGEFIVANVDHDTVIAVLRERGIPIAETLIQYIVPKDVIVAV